MTRKRPPVAKAKRKATSRLVPVLATPTTGPERIEPSLLPLAVPIGSVKLWQANYRQGDIGAVSESLRRFGQQKPVVAQLSSRTVIAGNHVLKAALALKWERLAVVLSDLNDLDATAYAIADNRTGDLATNDDAQLTELLKRMVEDGGKDTLVGTGYDGDDLDRILADLAHDAPEPTRQSVTCPKCGFVWSGEKV